MIHLRASLIESASLKKNITVQNYFRLYNREDLAERIDAILQVGLKSGVFLRDLIKESVDKYIAHYDRPSPKSDDISGFCVSFFSSKGRIPLKKFIQLLDGYIMALITEMWYDAGEFGIAMSDRNDQDRNVIINFGNKFAFELIQSLRDTI
jgi:hypothetical protein